MLGTCRWARAPAEGWNKKGTGPGLRLSVPVPPFGLRRAGILKVTIYLTASRLGCSMWGLAASRSSSLWCMGSVAVAGRLSCPMAWEILIP